MYLREDGDGNYVKVPTYSKIKSDNEKVTFYIKGLKFEHDSSKMKKTHLHKGSKDYPENLLLSEDVEDIMRRLQDKYPFGSKPSKDYPQMFVVCEKNDSIVTAYEVRWRYYIE